MKTRFFSLTAAVVIVLGSLVFNASVQAQDYDWSQTPEAQQMYNDLMNNVNQTYENTYNQSMQDAQQIMDQQKIDEQRYYNELMDMVNRSYEETYAEYMQLFEQIIADANANAKVIEAQLIAQGQAVYQQALASGYSNAVAQQMAVSTVGNIASTNAITNSFGHDLTMKIMNNWPNGSGALYKYADGSIGNWATRY
ncbi:hypothetical protein C7N43_21220 [Sphingobacteriales bacterium UPWRP_1]|nr:hypothetical protein BVG80_16095 [Sphingobacteriales bacterium TSM_CSM]PSJ74995.1 hypothetical protein C7N43_21220 [Sphingobacteriales bacterium UPWRP_1]